mgnify:CR=1 FL=1
MNQNRTNQKTAPALDLETVSFVVAVRWARHAVTVWAGQNFGDAVRVTRGIADALGVERVECLRLDALGLHVLDLAHLDTIDASGDPAGERATWWPRRYFRELTAEGEEFGAPLQVGYLLPGVLGDEGAGG